MIGITAGLAASAACGGAVIDETGRGDSADGGAPRDGGTASPNGPDASVSDPTPGHTSVDKRMFVSKDAYDATFGGLVGATQICMHEATDAGFDGEWTPYFCGGPGMDAKGVVASDTRYVLVNGEVVFEPDDAFVHGPANPIDVDTEGRVPSWIPDRAHIGLWTGCTFDGRYVANLTCNDFTQTTAGENAFGGVGIDSMWGGGAPIDCDQKAGILCVER